MASDRTISHFLSRLSDSGVLSDAALSEVTSKSSECNPDEDAKSFATDLVRQSKLTLFQANTLYKGLPVGLVLGNYVILDEIGSGGMGKVYRARHRRMNRIVAVKVLSEKAIQSAAAVARFHREVEAAARLSHPNIVAAYDADEADGCHYLVMEYIDGKDLEQQVKAEGLYAPEAALEVLKQAATALAYAHDQGVIHRDIKPGNILVDSSGVVRILDMGLASQSDDSLQLPDSSLTRLTQAGTLLGTVDFMSPEQAIDAREIDQTSDIYSLGCTFYYILTQEFVYPGDTPMERLIAHREAALPSLSSVRDDIPTQFDVLLHRMIAKKPSERYASAHDLLEAIEGWEQLDPDGSSDEPPPPSSAMPSSGEGDDDILPDDVLSQILGDD